MSFFLSTDTSQASVSLSSSASRIVAHRGASYDWPENTAAAFVAALESGAHAIECDVRLTRCGTPVVIHDPVLNRVSNGWGRVSVHTLDKLRQLNFGTAECPQQVLTLEELLEILSDYKDAHLFLETKHPLRYGRILEEQIALALRYAGRHDDPSIHIISFSTASLVRMRQLTPDLPRIFLRRDWYPRINLLPGPLAGVAGVGLSMASAKRNPTLVRHLPKPCYMWTLDNPSDITWAAGMGVEWIATNRPGIAVGAKGVAVPLKR